MRTLLLVSLLLGLGFGKRNEKAAADLEAAKKAYQETIARTGDFDGLAPEFDEVLRLFDAVAMGTPSKKEARDLAKRIREKRAAAGVHERAIDQAAANASAEGTKQPPASAVSAAAATSAPPGAAHALPKPVNDPALCKAARKKIIQLKSARKKAGKPPLGEVAFLSSGEVGYAPGAEPSPDELEVIRQLRVCDGHDPDENVGF